MSIAITTLLFVATSLSAIISAVSGMGGGIVLLSIMTFFLPLSTLIPIHGVVQLMSNISRTWLLRESVIKNIFLWFALGLPIGTFISIKIIQSIENKIILFSLIAALIFYSIFKPKKLPELRIPSYCFLFVGVSVGILGPLIGATGPTIAPFFMREDFSKEQIIATKSSVQVIGHLIKIPTFLYLGFNYLDHAFLIIALVVAAILGTHLGVKILTRVNDKTFRIVFKSALFLAGVRIVYKVLT
ncbi:sulfite exporter TauE/SafE family protein [Halobacteriovorax sp. HLS]|uniref:sulfite exporter TauE/SafE family protein n=1 Tax=Halobacteriovorax sp. HLS TaxID=2234000 RepID=UPI000FDAE161|nr:sulfite exporter TauE/SafE family protein [Halobacteriovorax sp. HLS]